MKKFILLMLVGLFSQTAWAGWVVTYQSAYSDSKSQVFYDGMNMNSGDMIYKDGYVILIDQNSQAYWKGTLQSYCGGMKVLLKEMKASMTSLAAEYQPKPISESKVSRKKLGTKSIAGFSANGYTFYVDGELSEQLWVSTDSGLSKLIDLERSMAKGMETCMENLSNLDLNYKSLVDTTIYKQTVTDAFILSDLSKQVISIEERAISSDKFNVPDGFKPFSDYGKFTKYTQESF